MTRDQERAFADWLEEATRVKRRKADRRRKAEARKLASVQARPERLAEQEALAAAHGGRLPPRWRYEDATKTVDGETVEIRKRIANRPAYISSYPYDPKIDGRGLADFHKLARERRDRIDNGFTLTRDVILSGCLVREGLNFSGFKSETLGTKSSLRWPALVHKSRELRVSWHRADFSDLELLVAAARTEGIPDWMLAEYGVEDLEPQPSEASHGIIEEHTNLRVLEPAHFKALGLDAPTVEGNKKLLGFLRLDTDLKWASTNHLMQALKEKVRTKKIKSMPNFVVGIRTEDGKLIRPHLIWLLPIDNGVLNVSNKFLRKFKAVYYGLCHALADLGADPQAPATSQLTKNPLSPLYHTECPSDEWPSLNEHASCLETGLDRMILVRKAIATVTGETFQHSNQFFNGCLDAARGLMATWHRDRNPVYIDAFACDDRGLLIDRLQEALSPLVVGHGMRPRSMEYARHKVASWVVDTWNPAKMGGNSLPSRGRLRHIVSEVQGVKERQAVAGRYTAAVRADKTIERLVQAWGELIGNGQPSKSALAKAAGLSRQTVHNRYEDLQKALSEGAVKDALMLYGLAEYAQPEESNSTIRQHSRINRPSETNTIHFNHIENLAFDNANDNDSDERTLAEHEAWIAFQEDRPCRPAVLDTVINIISKSTAPAVRQWQRYETANFDDGEDYIDKWKAA